MAENLANCPSLSSLGPDSHLSFGDQEPDFVDESDRARYTCPVHNGIFQNPCQTECGHRLCFQCVSIWLGGANSKRCPGGQSDCVDLTPHNSVYPDKCIERDLKNALVFCKNKVKGCDKQIKKKDLQSHYKVCPFEVADCEYSVQGCLEKVMRVDLKDHLKNCSFRSVRCQTCRETVCHNQLKEHEENLCQEKIVGCPYGCENAALKRKDKQSHKDVCSLQPIACKYKDMGCSFVNKKDLVMKHEAEGLSNHLELLLQRTTGLLVTVAELKRKQAELMERVFILEQNIVSSTELNQLAESLRQIQQNVNEIENQRHSQSGRGGSEPAGALVVPIYDTLRNMADEVHSQLDAHDQQLRVHIARMAEMDLCFHLLDTTSYDLMLVWKICDYQRRKTEAINRLELSLFSTPFYSKQFGYKMCARAYLNGRGRKNRNYMSLYLMREGYDSVLAWPFGSKVSFTLLDQSPEKQHMMRHFELDHASPSFQCPTSEMNEAYGFPQFIAETILEDRGRGFLKDDTIFIRIVVDQRPQNSQSDSDQDAGAGQSVGQLRLRRPYGLNGYPESRDADENVR